MLIGEYIALRAIERDDLAQLLAWRNNPVFRRHFREHRELSNDAQVAWYERTVLGDPTRMEFSIVRLADSELIGCAGLVYIDWVNRTADLSLYIGADDMYIDEVLAPDAARVVLRYAFDELDLARVWTEIYQFDSRKRSLLQSLGFQLEGTHREHHYTEGRRWDSLFFGILQREFQAR
jgi:hypothetical protein